MSKFWCEDPNHRLNWGEGGSLPVDPRTIHKTYNASNTSLLDTDRDSVTLGGDAGNTPINATEAQKLREIRDNMTPEHQ